MVCLAFLSSVHLCYLHSHPPSSMSLIAFLYSLVDPKSSLQTSEVIDDPRTLQVQSLHLLHELNIKPILNSVNNILIFMIM